MERIQRILNHQLFQSHLWCNTEAEIGGGFCGHDLEHSLDVARIAYIRNLESSLGFDKEIIYAAALLHDLTKWKQDLDGVPHHTSAIEPAKQILEECQFDSGEIDMITRAILNHRAEPEDETGFDALLYRADKLSRNCFSCKAAGQCNWSPEKKNQTVTY